MMMLVAAPSAPSTATSGYRGVSYAPAPSASAIVKSPIPCEGASQPTTSPWFPGAQSSWSATTIGRPAPTDPTAPSTVRGQVCETDAPDGAESRPLAALMLPLDTVYDQVEIRPGVPQPGEDDVANCAVGPPSHASEGSRAVPVTTLPVGTSPPPTRFQMCTRSAFPETMSVAATSRPVDVIATEGST